MTAYSHTIGSRTVRFRGFRDSIAAGRDFPIESWLPRGGQAACAYYRHLLR
jgi:hypothetical protein